jgi:hypothetical protein
VEAEQVQRDIWEDADYMAWLERWDVEMKEREAAGGLRKCPSCTQRMVCELVSNHRPYGGQWMHLECQACGWTDAR